MTGREIPPHEAPVTEVVAIDGPSGAGKSTVARALATGLGWSYLDTGAMYRAVTWLFLEHGCCPEPTGPEDPSRSRERRDLLDGLRLDLDPDGHVLVDGRDVTGHLRSREVESRVSAVSAMPFVRERMRELQRAVARRGPVVAEGRDMGTVVFPRARWKFYLDADPQERARRRHRDFVERGRSVTREDVLEEIQVRDNLDTMRADAPLRRAEGARYVDTTGMDVDEVVAALRAIVTEERASE